MSESKLDKEFLLKKFNATDELICYLSELVNCEIEKPDDEMDCDMIYECDKWLLELQGVDIKQIELPEEEIKKRVKAISDKYYPLTKPKRKRFTFKYATAILVFVFIGWLSFEAVSVTSFNNNFFDGTAFLSRMVVRFLRNNEMEQDDTVRVSSDAREYKTVDKLIKAEKVNIIVPNWLPDDKKVENIEYHNEIGTIYIKYDDEKTLLTIKLDSAMPDNTDGAQMIETNKIKFYIFPDLNIVCWEYDKKFYNFACGFDISEFADKVIENIK